MAYILLKIDYFEVRTCFIRLMFVLVLVCMERGDPYLFYDTNKTYGMALVFKFTLVVTTQLVNRFTEKGLVRRGLRAIHQTLKCFELFLLITFLTLASGNIC